MQAGEIFYNHISPTSSVCFLRSECIFFRIQAMIHTDDECTLKRAVVLSNPPTVRVQLGECFNVYNKFINIYCSLCTKTESSSLVKCSIPFFFIWEMRDTT